MIANKTNEKMNDDINDDLNKLGKLAKAIYEKMADIPNRTKNKGLMLEGKNGMVITIHCQDEEIND